LVAEEQSKVGTAVKQQVQIEVFAWLTRYVGGDGGGRLFFTEEFAAGESLQTVVRRMTRRFPDLDHVLWDVESGQIGASVEIIVNDAFLGITHTLESELQDGDMITLLPAWDGG
jgi:molybdopterin converting factor small subunit